MFAVLTPLIALASVTTMTEQEASVMMTDFDVIVDVRSESAYRQSHVRGAVLQRARQRMALSLERWRHE